jgi:Bacterial Ig-like domain (group 3)
VNQVGGSWGTAKEVPGTAALNANGAAKVTSVSCASPGNCSAGGYSEVSSNRTQAFVVTQTSGSWATAKEVPGTVALNAGGNAEVLSVSCASPGNCAAGGYLFARSGQEAFVVSQAGGTWATAKIVPGTFNSQVLAETEMVSCASPGICVAGGYYFARAGSRPFVADEAQATSTSLSLSAAKVTHGQEQKERLSVAVTARFSGVPSGSVTIKSGTGRVCTIRLASAKGSCKLTARQLAVGTHTLTATYNGSGYYNPSTSARKTLKVVS